MTYPEIFPVGSRITVRARPGDGSDYQFNGRTGTIEKWRGCSSAIIRFDNPPRGWPNPYCAIVAHCLTRESVQRRNGEDNGED